MASILTISHKKTMVYKYGCSDAQFNRFGGMALLFWNTIQDAKDKGFDEFEMGRSDGSKPGLISFKEHWGRSRDTVKLLEISESDRRDCRCLAKEHAATTNSSYAKLRSADDGNALVPTYRLKTQPGPLGPPGIADSAA